MTEIVDQQQGTSFNPFLPGYTDNPYPHFAELRARNPIEQNELGFWALWRYAEAFEVLRAKAASDRHSALNSADAGTSATSSQPIALAGGKPEGMPAASRLPRRPSCLPA